MREIFVADSEAEARRIAEGPMMDGLNFSNWRGPKIFLNPGEKLEPELEAELKKKLTYEFVAPRSVIFGSPDQVADKLWELEVEVGIEQVVVKSSWAGLSHEHTMRSLRRFIGEVIPRLNERRRRNQGAAAAAE